MKVMATYQGDDVREMDTKYEFGDMVTITGVDMYGFNGREEHPGPEHVGMKGEVVECRIIDIRVCEEDEPELIEFVRIRVLGSPYQHLEMLEFEIAPAEAA